MDSVYCHGLTLLLLASLSVTMFGVWSVIGEVLGERMCQIYWSVMFGAVCHSRFVPVIFSHTSL